jgi:hypothetical protein
MVAYRYPDESHPFIYIGNDYSEDDYHEDEYDGPIDSIEIASHEVPLILEILLDGIHYDSPAYIYYKTGERPDIYSMNGCHTPRFILVFRDKAGRASNRFSICFECSNAYFSNGLDYPASDRYGLSEEGRVAFQKLQASLFPE